jgi:hypothetical protein
MKADATGGCGPGGPGDILVPDTMYCLSVKASCCIHDWMYHWGETTEEKERADNIFLNNMIRQIKSAHSPGFLENLRLRRAKTYYNMVSWFGGPSFFANVNKRKELG